MRAVVQRVSEASVTIGGVRKGEIRTGLVVLVGIEETDTAEDLEWLSGKLTRLRIFNDEQDRRRLEGLIHPMVAELRDQQMQDGAADPSVKAYVWDTPLLLEAGLGGQCDAIVYVDTSEDQRLERVRRTRGWDGAELSRREKLQMPLDKKLDMANDIVRNTAGADDEVRNQVRKVLSRILAGISRS